MFFAVSALVYCCKGLPRLQHGGKHKVCTRKEPFVGEKTKEMLGRKKGGTRKLKTHKDTLDDNNDSLGRNKERNIRQEH